MTGVRITVRGEFVAHLPPERATVQLNVALEGPAPAPVYNAVGASSEQVSAGITALHGPDGPVTWFVSDSVRTWAARPWNQDGRQLPIVHHASVAVQVKFNDFEAMSIWLGSVVEIEGVGIEGLDWTLTEMKQREATRQVRSEAVRNAREKAQEYADALDLGPVHVLEIADAGMLGANLYTSSDNVAMAYARGGTANGPEIEFIGEDIPVATSIDARFEIRAHV